MDWQLNSVLPAFYAETPKGTYWIYYAGEYKSVVLIEAGSSRRLYVGWENTVIEAKILAETHSSS